MAGDNGLSPVTSTTAFGNSESIPPAAKRRRIGLACSACRIRKSRCNGARPKCEPCQRLHFECIYELAETSANLLVPKDVFARLEDRVRVLEASVSQQDSRLRAVEDGRPRDSNLTGPVPAVDSDPDSDATSPGGGVVINIDGIQDTSAENSMTDGMATSLVDEQDCGFFGPSSNIAFMRHIFRAMAKRSQTAHDDGLSPGSNSNIGMYGVGITSVTRQASPTTTSRRPTERGEKEAAGTNLLPPHSETVRLIRAYFSNTGLLFPFIHQQTFLATYEDLRSHNFGGRVRRTWLGLLNMVLAMAVCTSGWAEDGGKYQPEQSDMYYRRARELCKTQMLRGTTLETVQYLLLTSQYLQGTQKSVQTWTTHGLAVKAALSIGLHSAEATTKFSPIEQEMRKRTWFGCVLLDRSLSMTFGRPSAIPEDYVKIDLPAPLPPCDDEEQTAACSSVAFFNITILLYRFVWKIMATLYGHNLGCGHEPSEVAMMTQIVGLEQELSEWQQSIPRPLLLLSSSYVRSDEYTVEDAAMERFRLILTLRHLHVQLLLHRPSLTKSLAHVTVENAAGLALSISQMQVNFNRTCVRVAEEIVDIIHAVLTRPSLGRHLIGAWWFTLYYTFNAVLVIFGSLLVPVDDPPLGPAAPASGHRVQRARQFLEKAIEVLIKLEVENHVLNRCIAYLRQLEMLASVWASPSRTFPEVGGHISMLQPAHSAPAPVSDGDGDASPYLLAQQPPPLFDKSPPGFEDELELGYFATEFQRWFGQFQA